MNRNLWIHDLLAGQQIGVGAKARKPGKTLFVIRVTWNKLVFAFFTFILLGSLSLRESKPSLRAGTDMFWAVYEAKFGCEPCPEEAEAIRQLRASGYKVEE